MKQLMQKTEAYYIQDNEREMPQVTDELYFVISEIQNSVDMTDKGHDVLANSVSDPNFFVLPDMGSAIAEITHDASLSAAEKAEKKDALMEDFSLVDFTPNTLITLQQAHGKVARFYLLSSAVAILAFPCTWVMYRCGLPAWTGYAAFMGFYVLKAAVMLAVTSRETGLPVGKYLREALFPALFPSALVALAIWPLTRLVHPGKKLGFIIQEMGREINTTGSKANHAGIQKLVVQMKDELEKMREQSMNIL